MTNGADRWKCKDCGRYELFDKPKEPMKPEIIQAILGGEVIAEPEELTVTGTEARVCAMIAQRQQFGLNKYKVSVEENPLSAIEWMQHLREELADALVYATRLQEEMEKKADDGR